MNPSNVPEVHEEEQARGSPGTTFRIRPDLWTQGKYLSFLITADTKFHALYGQYKHWTSRRVATTFLRTETIRHFLLNFSEPEMASHFLRIFKPEMLKTFPARISELSNFISEFFEFPNMSRCQYAGEVPCPFIPFTLDLRKLAPKAMKEVEASYYAFQNLHSDSRVSVSPSVAARIQSSSPNLS